MSRSRHRFRGRIAGVGTTYGVRVVVGHWRESPLGAFSDVMLAEPDGRRHLLAPSREVADYVASTYTFDEVHVVDVDVAVDERPGAWHVRAGDLDLRVGVGRRTALGVLLRLVPRALAEAPWWTAVTDPVARRLLRGVRTRGSAGGGRREYYGATDLRKVVSAGGSWAGRDLGTLAPVAPEPRFGFGSTPEEPSVTDLVTTVLLRERGSGD
ncbi:hypothetical protein [Nocardioides marmoraquaticus]